MQSRLVYYPNENHWILKPQNSIFWYQEKRSWLKEWIGEGPEGARQEDGAGFGNGRSAMSDNWKSRAITEGQNRAPNRAMLRAVGFGDDDFDKPIIGVANGYSNITPCNAGLERPGRSAPRRPCARRRRCRRSSAPSP